jgi:hypothetical protein
LITLKRIGRNNMDQTDQDFIQKAYDAGLNDDEVKQAVIEWNKKKSTIAPKQSGNILTSLLGIDANKFQQGQETINTSGANPLLKAGATAQNALANSGQILPMLYGGIARSAVPVPGLSSGIGAAFGQRLQQMNQRGGIESVVPTQQESGQAALTGLGYGATDLAATAIGQALQKIKKPLISVLKNPLPKGAGENVGKAAEAATKEGKQIGWNTGENNIQDQIVEAVKNKFGDGKAVRDATNSLIAELTPTPPTVTGSNGLMKIGESQFSPNNLLQTRSQITAKTGPAIFSAIKGGNAALEDKVAGIARSVISQNLHKLAPETLSPDMALSIYHRLGIFGKLGLPGVVGGAVLGKTAANKAGSLIGLLGLGQ